MTERDIAHLRHRLRNIRIESEALRLEEEALVARIAIVEQQQAPNANIQIDRPLAVGDRVRILNPSPDRRGPRDIIATVINLTRHFVTVRSDSGFIVRRAPHNVERTHDVRVTL
jgi:hypothetical protein